MKKLESSFRNMVLVLTGVTALAVLLLAGVNQLTAEPIREAKSAKLVAAISEVISGYDNDPAAHPDTLILNGLHYVVYEATKEGESIGAAVETIDPKGFSGAIKLLVGFDVHGDVLNYSILSTQETPGLGSKADVWFKQGERGDIIGKNPGKKPLSAVQDGGDVDAITASTITTRAFLRAVNNAYQIYREKQTGMNTSETSGVSGATGATSKKGKEEQQ